MVYCIVGLWYLTMLQSDVNKIETDLKPYKRGIQKKIEQIELTELLNSEYINKYLSKINSFPTQENIQLVQTNMNIDHALILPDWTRGKLMTPPNMKNKKTDYKVNEIFRFVNSILLNMKAYHLNIFV